MHIVLHCGVHSTDNGQVHETLAQNMTLLNAERVELVPQKNHRGLFRDAVQSLSGGTATDEMEQVLLDAMLQSDAPRRAILSAAGLLGTPSSITGRNGLYPGMGARLSSLVNLFPNCTTEIFVAIRNPATLLSSMIDKVAPRDVAAFLNACQYYELRWNEPIRRLVQAVQGRRIVIWSDEDAPFIWPDVVHMIADAPEGASMHGTLDYLRVLLSPEGLAKLDERMMRSESISRAERLNLCAELLSDNAAPDQIEQEIALSGWNQDMVDEVSELYYRDIQEIAALPGVEFVSPQTI